MFTCFYNDSVMKGGKPKCKALLFFICRIAEVNPIFDALGDDRRRLRSNTEQEANGSIFDVVRDTK